MNLLTQPTRKLTISLDYDGTVTEDRSTWQEVARTLRAAGHTVYVVTMRGPDNPIDKVTASLVDGVYYTKLKAKRRFMADLGIQVSIWIDDMPDAIICDY